MNNNELPRLRRITNSIADSAESGITEAGQTIVSVLISDAAKYLMDEYNKWKRSRSQKPKYLDLQKYIEVNNETVQIGMDKKELAIMWAMKELGYNEEKIKEILDLANKAYSPKEEG